MASLTLKHTPRPIGRFFYIHSGYAMLCYAMHTPSLARLSATPIRRAFYITISSGDSLMKTYRSMPIFILSLFLLCMGCNPHVSSSVNASNHLSTQTEDTHSNHHIQKIGQIYIYGERHATPWILEKELELWSENYHQKGYRHLFVELPYYTAEYLNIWMHEPTDDIINTMYEEWKNSSLHHESVLNFYKTIKQNCPETIFHGIDVGHAYDTTGKRFLKYIKDTAGKDSDMYKRTEEAIEQGEIYYGKRNHQNKDHVYRENRMTQNFIREYKLLEGADIMGIFGGAHTDIKALDQNTKTIPCMANQLQKIFGDSLHTQNLSIIDSPISIGTMKVKDKEYQAAYFGKGDLSKLFPKYQYREFWRLENAYEDFKDNPVTGNVLPYSNYSISEYRNSKDNYAINIELKNIYVIDYIHKDGTKHREYHRANGRIFKNQLATEEIKIH